MNNTDVNKNQNKSPLIIILLYCTGDLRLNPAFSLPAFFFFFNQTVHKMMTHLCSDFVISPPPTYGKLIKPDGNYPLTLRVSVRLSQIKVIYRGGATAVGFACICLQGLLFQACLGCLFKLWSKPFCLLCWRKPFKFGCTAICPTETPGGLSSLSGDPR